MGCSKAEELLRAAKAVLVPGGFVLFDFLNAAAKARHAHAAEEKTHFAGPEITSLAHRAGFKTVNILGDLERRVRLLLAE